jgi:hypothetical protein
VQGVPVRECGEILDGKQGFGELEDCEESVCREFQRESAGKSWMENRALGSLRNRSQCAPALSCERVRGSHGWKRSEGCAGKLGVRKVEELVKEGKSGIEVE